MSRIILPVPHYPQDEAGECLAICALVVLTFLNHAVSLPQLHELLKIAWFGTAFSNIKALKQIGVIVEVGQGNLSTLYAALDNKHPVIVAVDTQELSYTSIDTMHTIVLIGRDNGLLYLHDPMITTHVPVAVPEDEFQLAWLAHDEQYAIIRS